MDTLCNRDENSFVRMGTLCDRDENSFVTMGTLCNRDENSFVTMSSPCDRDERSVVTMSAAVTHYSMYACAVTEILPPSAATPPTPAFSLVDSCGISEMLSTCPESRLSVSLICCCVALVAIGTWQVHILDKGGI